MGHTHAGTDCFQDPCPADGAEKRIVNDKTGGAKGSKLPQLGWCPPASLLELGKAYGVGAEKYEPRNFARGYEWSLSYNAMQRHVLAWHAGESFDAETGVHHLAHVAWHCMTLMHFEQAFPEMDDVRWTPVALERHGVAPKVEDPYAWVLGRRVIDVSVGYRGSICEHGHAPELNEPDSEWCGAPAVAQACEFSEDYPDFWCAEHDPRKA